MINKHQYDAIIIGGSYAGLAAGMALGRALRSVLIIDSGEPCNRQTPWSHNFITQDGQAPKEITALAKQQLAKYDTVVLFNGKAIRAVKIETGFEIQTETRESFTTRKIIFAAGIKDIIPAIAGFSECWGISVLHCPYCHGYEVRGQKTGIVANGDDGFALSKLISNWTNDLTLYTNGRSTLTNEQTASLQRHNISIKEDEIVRLVHKNGYLQDVIFKNATSAFVKAIYTRVPFVQHCFIPEHAGCALTSDGYINVDPLQRTNIPGVFACGDSTTRIRTIANVVASGTTTGMMVNKELIEEDF